MPNIDEAWRQLLPFFQNGYDFVYAFLDFATVLGLLTILVELPSAIFLGKKGRGDLRL